MSRADSGFSLIETMVALGVTGMLSMAGTQLMLQTMRSGDAIEAKTESVRTLQIAHSLLKDDLAHAVIEPRRVTSDGMLFPEREFEFAQDTSGESMMSFIRSGWEVPFEAPNRSDLQYVSYTFVDGMLVRDVTVRPDPVRDTPSVSRILITGLDDLTMRYRIGEVWIDNVTPVTAASVEALEVTFDFGDNQALVQTFQVSESHS